MDINPALRLALALAARGFHIPENIIKDAARNAGVSLTFNGSPSTDDHLARHAALAERYNP